MTGFDYDILNGVEDITRPGDIWRKHRLTGELTIRLHLPAGADQELVAVFKRIQDFIADQIMLLQEEERPMQREGGVTHLATWIPTDADRSNFWDDPMKVKP